MKKLICLIISFCYFSVLATEKKAEVAYLTERYKQITSLLSENLTIEQLAAELSLRTFDIRYFQDIIQFAKERNIDSKKERIMLRSSQNKLFVDGLKNPLIVANSPELKISYMGDEIPFSAKLSPLENLYRMEKFFNTHSGSTASTKWHNLLFGMPEAQGLPIVIVYGLVAFLVLILLTLTAGVSLGKRAADLLSRKSGIQTNIFKGKDPLASLKFSCENNSQTAILESGKERYSFTFKRNEMDSKTKENKNQIEISYSHERSVKGLLSLSLEPKDEMSIVTTKSSIENHDLTQNLESLKLLVPLMTKEDPPGSGVKTSICPMSDADTNAWNAAIKIVRETKHESEINLPAELNTAITGTSK